VFDVIDANTGRTLPLERHAKKSSPRCLENKEPKDSAPGRILWVAKIVSQPDHAASPRMKLMAQEPHIKGLAQLGRARLEKTRRDIEQTYLDLSFWIVSVIVSCCRLLYSLLGQMEFIWQLQ